MERTAYDTYRANLAEAERQATIRNLTHNMDAAEAMWHAKDTFLTQASDLLAAWMRATAEYHETRGVSRRQAEEHACADLERDAEDNWLELMRDAYRKADFA